MGADGAVEGDGAVEVLVVAGVDLEEGDSVVAERVEDGNQIYFFVSVNTLLALNSVFVF